MSILKEIHRLATMSIRNGSRDQFMHEIHELSKPRPPSIKYTGLSQQLKELLPEFFASRPIAEKRYDLLIGSSWVDSKTNRHYFRIKYLLAFLKRNGWHTINKYALVQLIRELGGDNHHMNIEGEGVHVTWVSYDIT